MIRPLTLFATLLAASVVVGTSTNQTEPAAVGIRPSSHHTISSICGSDQSVPAKCYRLDTALGATLPLAYERAHAVVRLHIDTSGGYCTAYLVGSEGHLLTNNHCIGSQADASAIKVEFDAESASCADQCAAMGGCPGAVVAMTSTLVATDPTIDYALVKLPTNEAAKKYGYLQLRASGPVVNEPIYIPGHPYGKAKRIAAVLDDGSVARVKSLDPTGTSCNNGEPGATIVHYAADTEGGSSGSPIIAVRDNAVVAIHNCGGCSASGGANGGVDVRDIIKDLNSKGVVVPDLLANGVTTPRPTTPAPTLPPAGQCDGLVASACQQVFFCTWNSLAAKCQRWWK